MAKKKDSLSEKVKKVKDKAYGTKEIKIYKKPTVKDYLEVNDRKINRRAQVLSNAKRIISTRDNAGLLGTTDVAKVKKTDVDAYNLLAKRAKAKGLKGAEAKAAIEKAFKSTARTVKTERSRSATRAQGIANRQSKKRKNTDLTR